MFNNSPSLYRTLSITLALSLLLSSLHLNAAAPSPVILGFDGEYGLKASTSAQAIELGIQAAIHEINNSGGVLGGRPLELITKDNRSVPARAIANLNAFAAIPDLVAVYGGRFSPVQLQQLDEIHRLEIPLLDVWGAADGITDHKYVPSYTFRLSLKDSWAMPAMVEHLQKLGIHKIGAMLPNTGWGRSNEKALVSTDIRNSDIEVVHTQWYNWGESNMLQHYELTLAKGAEAVIFVANDIEGSMLVRQLGETPSVKRVPIASHWGVTGGDMVKNSGPALMDLDYAVVQTFSFFNADSNSVQSFLKTVKEIAGVERIEAIESPVGVGHAYDMTHILAKAIDKAGSTDRAAIRDALEGGIEHNGLVRQYLPAFTKDSHDALKSSNLFMAKFHADETIRPLEY